MSVGTRTPITDSGLRAFAGYTMKRAFNAIRADVTVALQPFGLRMVTFSVLSVIVENPGLRQSELADVLAIERPNMVALVDELVREGLILRERAAEDRRASALSPTARGREIYGQAFKAVSAHDRHMTRRLSPAARRELIAMLKDIERAGGEAGDDDT